MSKKNNKKQENNSRYVILYIAVTAVLLACLVFFALANRQRKKSYEAAVEAAAQGETEYVMTERQRESESDAVSSDTASSQNGVDKNDGDQDEISRKRETEKEQLLEGEGETDGGENFEDGETEKDSTPELQPEHTDLTILVLNGTKRPGVAGYWKERLTEIGYETVISATYGEEAEEYTVIYTDEIQKAEEIEVLFPDCKVEKGSIENGISLESGEELPEKIDLYLVIGKQDAPV